MFTKVNNLSGFFHAKNSKRECVVIEHSISFLFLRTEDKPKHISYTAVTYKNHTDVLHQLNDYLTGATYETGLLDRVVIRCGWMDKKLNSLEFIPFLDLVKRFRSGTPTKRDRLKLMQICKQLSISMRGLHVIPKTTPAPINIMDVL